MSQKTWPFLSTSLRFAHWLRQNCSPNWESAKGPSYKEIVGRLGARAMHKRLHKRYLSATCMVDGFEHVLPEKILELSQN